MTIYNLNHGIGWASSGVEYAQAYRANLFRKNGQYAKFIFTDLFYENLQGMTHNIGFEDDEIIWLYQFFTNVKVSPTTFTTQELEQSFPIDPTATEKSETTMTYIFSDQDCRLTAFLDQHRKNDTVYKTEWVVKGNLIQRDYYSYVKTFSEYLKPVENRANVYQRRFFNENGSLAYEEILNGGQSMYIFPGQTIYSKENLIAYFIECLNLTCKDILIIDRSTGMGPEILKNKGKAKVGVVVHAEHFSKEFTTDKKILWNNYYDYQLENAKSIDFFVTATKRQEEVLKEQFIKYGKGDINIHVIPVGSIDMLKKKQRRPLYTLITASRLASEKHLDWLIRSVVKSKAIIKELSLDIYGRGAEEGNLTELIRELGAEEYIHLMGHHPMEEVYLKYATYISASTSEGFGLTLLEAIGSGLLMIGFDVPYGNQTFIKDGENGKLIGYTKNDTENNISRMSDAIIELYQSDKRSFVHMRQTSYDLAQPYLTTSIQKLWLKLEQEMIHD